MKILVTGGAGFIGSTLCNKLRTAGHNVVSFDNFSRKTHIFDNKIKSYNDVRDIDNLRDFICETTTSDGFTIKEKKIDALWHFAYINGTSTFYSNPADILDVGVKGAINTIDVALEFGIKNYVLCSSSEVYNEPSQIPTPETERLLIPDVHNPRFSYSGGKIISELLTIHYGARKGLNTKIFRPHNVYGPNMGTEHVIPELIKKIISPLNPSYVNKKLVVNIQGSGHETRAFCYIDDAIDEMLLAGLTDNESNSNIYNIGIENEISITELAYTIAKILDIEIMVTPTEAKPNGSSNRRCPSMKKLTELGYKQTNSLYDGLTKTIEWYKKFYEGRNE